MINNLCARLALRLLQAYRRLLSPLLPPTCRYYPTCSAYAAQAFRVHGLWRGFCLTLKRVIRCHPWHPGGIDPVPPAAPPYPGDSVHG